MTRNRRFLPALRDALTPGHIYDQAHPAYGPDQDQDSRDAALAVALARLETCARHRDPAAAARALDGMAAGSDDGAWLLLQMAAAGLRALSASTQQLSPATVHTRTRDQAVIVADTARLTAGHTQGAR